jgi:hypothetical protein
VQYIQGKSKPNPNWAKLSQIQQNPAKDNQGKSLDFLGDIALGIPTN